MTSRSAQIALTVVCVLFGMLLMMQFRMQGTLARSSLADSPTDQAQIIANLYDNNVSLRQEVEKLEAQHFEHQQTLRAGGLGSLVADLNKYRVINGLSEARGPGVELLVAANIRAEDMQDLINEFRNAGSEALSINAQRVALRTSVRPDRGVVVVNNTLIEPPYVFEAVGSPDILERALTRKGGLVSYLTNTYPDAVIRVTKKADLVLPVYSAGFTFKYAQPVK